MAEALESRLLRFYGDRPGNYLNDWVRRTGHFDDLELYAVEVTVDSVGATWGHIVRKQEAPVAETPPPSYNRNADAPPAKPGRGKKAADKSVFD